MKVLSIGEAKKLSDIPNIGQAMVKDLGLLGIKEPQDLQGKDGYVLYTKLCKITGVRQDPCVLDTFIAIVDFAHGAPARPWFYYTEGRKQKYVI